jgi:hypothetical protein
MNKKPPRGYSYLGMLMLMLYLIGFVTILTGMLALIAWLTIEINKLF